MIYAETERLILRDWQEEDITPFAAMNQDPRVMECFPNTLTEIETRALVERIKVHIKQHGFGLYVCVLKGTQEFIGFVGLSVPNFTAHFTPCVEIGWRLAFPYWNKGYATEAAGAVLKMGFEQYHLKEIVSFTVVANQRSRHVMEKLGMTHNVADDFDHPNVSIQHPLCRHVLYRLSNYSWRELCHSREGGNLSQYRNNAKKILKK